MPLMWRFFVCFFKPVSLLLILLITVIFLTYVHNKFTFTKFLQLCFSNGGSVSIPTVSNRFYNFTFDSDFTSNIITFQFFAAFSSLLANSFFPSSVFVKRHVGLSLGDKAGTQRCLWVNWRTSGQWPPVNRLKEAMWLVTDRDAHPLLTSWSVDWRASCKVCNLSNYSRLRYFGNWNLNYVGRDWCYLSKWWWSKRGLAHQGLPVLNIFRLPNSSLVPICSQCPAQHPGPVKHWHAFCHCSFVSSRISYQHNQTIWSLSCLASFI